MQRASEFLGTVVRKFERPEAVLAWLASSWRAVVGPTLAAHTIPVRCVAGRPEVAIDGKSWQKQIENLKMEFCERINREWGGRLIREVKFMPAKPKRAITREADNLHTPFIRRRGRGTY